MGMFNLNNLKIVRKKVYSHFHEVHILNQIIIDNY